MDIKKYGGKHSEVVNLLYKKGIIDGYPSQMDRSDLQYDDGVDIVFRFKNLTPKKLDEYADMILLAAFQEAERYKEYRYKFAKISVAINRTAKGRKTIEPVLTYTAAKHHDANVLVYGEEALGYDLPEDEKRRPFLKNKIEEILDIADRYQPDKTVQKVKPFKVISMVIGIREGLRSDEAKNRYQKRKEAQEQGTIVGRGGK